LFGHIRGALTGADTNKKGLVEAADTGTLFLDEIGELPRELQAKLLRVIQEKEVRPRGFHRRQASQRKVHRGYTSRFETRCRRGAFRRDLYYRLNVFPIEMPPLRERKVDIPLLVTTFLTKHADSMRPIETICQDFWRSVMSRDWPGNVRELENFVARCIALGSGPTLRDEDGCLLTEEIGKNALVEKDTHRLDAMERYTIVKVLQETKGDKIAAARILGIGKTTIYRKVRQYGQNPI
jgi:DNA-binding NtrC family response regulator